MKHIRKHYKISMYKTSGRNPKLYQTVVTIVGDLESNDDGSIKFTFGAARKSFKDNFSKKLGMMLATERYYSYPHTITLFPSGNTKEYSIQYLAEFIAINPRFIKVHFKS